MKQWHFIESGEQRGPHPETDILRMLEDGRLTPETRLWTEGMQDWTPLRIIPDFTLSPYTPPATEPAAGVTWDSYAPTGPQTRPWVRYWARTLDYLFFAMICGVVFEMALPEVMEIPDALFGILVAVLFIFVEAVLFAVTGTTPFKALLNIRVRNRIGRKLGFSEALARAFNVFVRGLGLGIPIVTLVTNYTSYQRLNTTGSTSWDTSGGFTVSHRKIGLWRLLVLIGIVIVFIAVIALGIEQDG